jgi:Asp-tRNA(Asn)/Glu-tRNA(Gln) amidotransferase A subunit family amidase
VGVQLIAEPFAESLLLQLGRDLETSYGWLDRCPATPPAVPASTTSPISRNE